MQTPRASDIVEILTIEKISVIGLLLLLVITLAYFVWSLQKTIKTLRTENEERIITLNKDHRNEIVNLNDAHEKKYDELMNKLMAQMERHVEVYKNSQSANQQFIDSIKHLKNA